MTKKALLAKIEELNEWEQVASEAAAVVSALKDEIKQEMIKRKVDEFEVGKYIIRYTPVVSNNFDSTAFKKQHLDLYKEFLKQTSSRRFTISK